MDRRKPGGKKQESNSKNMDLKSTRMELKSIMKDIEYIGPSHMTWKEKKAMENRKVVSLGGKPPKKHRIPLSVALVPMKRQKEREQKILQENIILGQVGGKRGNRNKRSSGPRKPEDRVLLSIAGHFRNGILDVKDLLKSKSALSGSRSRGFGGDPSSHAFGGGSSSHGSGKGGKKGGKKKGGRRKGH